MPKFTGPPGRAREICQSYVDGAAPFVGQQQGFGVTFAVAAVLALGLGAAISNADSGKFLDKNRKSLLLTSAGAFAILCYNFLDNAKSAAASAAQASIALASTKDDEMWSGCQHAHAAYFDGRAAGISATRDAVARDTAPRASTPSADVAPAPGTDHSGARPVASAFGEPANSAQH
jgi:hypothetical protein